MKLKVKYIYEATYEFDDEDTDSITATDTILEDFHRLDGRADNILPPFTTTLHIEYLTPN